MMLLQKPTTKQSIVSRFANPNMFKYKPDKSKLGVDLVPVCSLALVIIEVYPVGESTGDIEANYTRGQR